MSYLDWYLHLNQKCRERGYDLTLTICPDPEIVVRKIIPQAVEIACKNARKQDRRHNLSRKHWKLYFTDSQLYQISILEASLNHAKQSGCPLANWLVRYIGFLSLCTLQHNSFYVAVGFARILNAGSTKETLELYEWLSNNLAPDEPPDGRDEKSANDICSSIHEQIYREFKDGFHTSSHRLMLDEVAKGTGGISDEIYQILDKLIPWETDHLPTANHAYARGYQRIAAEMLLAHVCIDQQRCLEDVKRNNGHISNSFDKWKIPIPNSAAPVEPSGPQAPHWRDMEEEIMKEIHWSEEKSKREWGAIFEVIVDGEIKDSIECGGSIHVTLPPLARYVEIRDAESKAMLANCHLMDPQDVPEVGWKSSVKARAGGRIDFEFYPDKHGNEMAGLAMKIDVIAKPAWATSIRNWIESLRFNFNQLAIKAIGVAALITVMSLVVFRVGEKLSHISTGLDALQRENLSLKQEYAELQSKMEKQIVSGEETRQALSNDQKALEQKLAQLQSENKALTTEIARNRSQGGGVVVFQDTSGRVRVNSNGTVSLPDGSRLPPHLSRLARELATKGTVTAKGPALAALSTLRSNDIRGEIRSARIADRNIPIPRSPLLTAIRSTRPTFQWEAVTGAQQYRVTVAYPEKKENGKVIWESGGVAGTEVSLPPGKLRQGEVYRWQVEALVNGNPRLSPAVGFWVLDEGSLRQVQAVEQSYKNSALMLASVYAAHGLYEEALMQVEKLSDISPTNVFIQDALRSLRRQLNKE